MKKITLTNVETVIEKGSVFLDVTYEFDYMHTKREV